MRRRPFRVTAGTQLIDGFWKHLKRTVVHEQTRCDRHKLYRFALALLWRTFQCGDPVAELGSACAEYVEEAEEAEGPEEAEAPV